MCCIISLWDLFARSLGFVWWAAWMIWEQHSVEAPMAGTAFGPGLRCRPVDRHGTDALHSFPHHRMHMLTQSRASPTWPLDLALWVAQVRRRDSKRNREWPDLSVIFCLTGVFWNPTNPQVIPSVKASLYFKMNAIPTLDTKKIILIVHEINFSM